MSRILFVFLIPIFLFTSLSSRANHLFGGELYYTHVSGLNYKITLALYADCGTNSAAYTYLELCRPHVLLLNNQVFFDTARLVFNPASGEEISPVCPAELMNTTCNGGTLPGVRKFEFSKTVTLPANSTNWRFLFTGELDTSSASGTLTSYSAGRSINLTSIVTVPSVSIMSLEAMLNNMNGHNSSPQFTTIPTPFYCANVAQGYNQGAVDVENDSLAFELTPATQIGGTVNYISPYSPTYPVSTTTGLFDFNPLNGQMNFTPDIVQNALVVTTVSEYRNGVLKGTAAREMSFIILNNCQNTPATDSIDLSTVNGGIKTPDNVVNVCEGGIVSFGNNISDPDGDILTVTTTSLPGALINVTGNNTQNPSLAFNWNTTGVAAGIYNFFVTVTDNHCPLSSTQTEGFTIRIIKPNTFNATVLSPTDCKHQAYMRFNLTLGLLPRTVQIKQGAVVIHSYTDSTGVILDSLAAGNYTVTISNPELPCSSTYNFVVPDGGIYPDLPTISSNNYYYCQNDPPAPLIAVAVPGGSIHWYDAAGNILPGTPAVSTAVPGVFTWFVTQQYNVCESLKDTIRVFVTPPPVSTFTTPAGFCLGDTAWVNFTGSAGLNAVYNWNWDGGQVVAGQGAGPYRVIWTTLGVKNVSLVVDDQQCFSDTSFVQVTVKPTPEASFVLDNICVSREITIKYNGNLLQGTQFAWTFENGSPATTSGIGPHEVIWADTGHANVTLTTSLDGCFDTMTRDVIVYPSPDVAVINKDHHLCYGDKVFLQATGHQVFSYAWYPRDQLFYEPDSSVFVRLYQPSTFTVVGTTVKGCTDSASVSFTQIEACCRFSYPNSFTPNGDGHNDRWRVLVYGNQENFELTVFNRWGESVFHTIDPTGSWDGTYKGQQADLGTYYFYVKSNCLTGAAEENKGELYLIR